MTTISITDKSQLSLAQKILKQVEFYFSDANFPRDKFLQAEVAKDEGGWVGLEVLTRFARLKALSEDCRVIAEALRASPALLEVDEEGIKVRRKTTLIQSDSSSLLERTFYVKGFPRADASVTLDVIEETLQTAGIQGIMAIRMRRFVKSRDFRGSAFVEMSSAEAVEKALACKPTYQGKSLSLESKQAYLVRKNAERTARDKSKNSKSGVEYVAPEFAPGCVVILGGRAFKEAQGLALPEHTAFKADLEAKTVEVAVKVAYVQFRPADTILRLKEPKAEAFALALNACDESFGARPATAEEESTYYAELTAYLREKAANNNRGRPASHHKGRNANRKRSSSNDTRNKDCEENKEKRSNVNNEDGEDQQQLEQE